MYIYIYTLYINIYFFGWKYFNSSQMTASVLKTLQVAVKVTCINKKFAIHSH